MKHALLILGLFAVNCLADDFQDFLKPLFAENCVKCHGDKKTKGKVDLYTISSKEQFLSHPGMITDIINAIDSFDMPPEDEPELEDAGREKLLLTLKNMLREATAHGPPVAEVRVRRLNRFQYNNALRDLFRLKKDVFLLQEKMMIRHINYLARPTDTMPEKVTVSCLPRDAKGGFADVRPFPKDLRALHGFDNQSNQLTMSPLLLDTFLKLSVSILSSPDFNEKMVGIWKEFFMAPAEGTDVEAEVRTRLAPFLNTAFRCQVDAEIIDRYVAFTVGKITQGMPFTDAMKKVTSAVLSSPLFLYRYRSGGETDHFELASRLSFFLWGSAPDEELLRLATAGELVKPKVLDAQIERMLKSPKIERFLDTFPAQWMQLENLMAATPDPKKFRFYSFEPKAPGSHQMVLEPLLLFDSVFVENRPIIDLIAPDFGYRSDFLSSWYDPDGLKAPKLDPSEADRINKENDDKRTALQAEVTTLQNELKALVDPVRERLLELRQAELELGAEDPVDLQPYAAWEFDGDLKDSISGKALKTNGEVSFENGTVVLQKAFLQSENLPIDFKAKTLEARILLKKTDQRGGGVIGFQGPGDFFDTIVLGEIAGKHWISGSNGHKRTKPFPDSTPENAKPAEPIHVMITYAEDGTTTMYRNGEPYGKPYKKGQATFPKGKTSIIFGLRHLPPGGNKYLNLRIDSARIYDRALTAEEAAAAVGSGSLYIPDKAITQALDKEARIRKAKLMKEIKTKQNALAKVPKPLDSKAAQATANKQFDNEIRQQIRSRDFMRVPMTDPRYGGIITNAAALTMTSGPQRTKPISRGSWLIEVVFNDPPPPPPNDVPPLDETAGPKNQTIREKFAQHREMDTCASCHTRIDPLGFALENFDSVGRWRDKYENKRDVDASGKMLKKYVFEDIVDFKKALVEEDERFAKAFTAHLLRFALARELSPGDTLVVEEIAESVKKDDYRLKSIIREVIHSKPFLH
ncbi:MAG: hypothetical protein ACI8W8_002478 [Rhodothermales bacterium]|jgi:hypothetical protein